MRNIFLALVLANLAFAAWHAWFAERPVASHPQDPDLPPIVLLKELPPEVAARRSVGSDSEPAPGAAVGTEPAPAAGVESEIAAAVAADSTLAAPAASAPPAELSADRNVAALAAALEAASGAPPAERGEPPPQIVPNCTSVGPFRELAQAATAAANLRAAGYEPLQRAAEGELWIGYWIYVDAIATEAQANEILANIRANGIPESYVIPNTDSGHLISLGVFSEIGGVTTQRDRVRALGYEPTVVDRTRRATVYWVDVTLAEGQALALDALQTPGRIVRLEQRPCEAPVTP